MGTALAMHLHLPHTLVSYHVYQVLPKLHYLSFPSVSCQAFMDMLLNPKHKPGTV